MESQRRTYSQAKKNLEPSNELAKNFSLWKYLEYKNIISGGLDTEYILQKNNLTFENILDLTWAYEILKTFERTDLNIKITLSAWGSIKLLIDKKSKGRIQPVEILEGNINFDAKIISNDSLQLWNNKWQWYWLRIIKTQVEVAQKFWFNLEATLARAQKTNWYYSFARMWFVMKYEHNKEKLEKICKESNNKNIIWCKSLTELLSTKEWCDFWKENWFSFMGIFETHKWSESWEILNSYIKEKWI